MRRKAANRKKIIGCNGITEKEYKTCKENFLKRFQLTKLPPYLIFCIKRFTKNNFFVEKNPTIVNFPITNVDLREYLSEEVQAVHKNTTYDLIANIVHDGKPTEGSYRIHVLHHGMGKWYELQDLQQLSNGFSEDLEVLDTDSSEGTSRLGPICFCPDAQQNAETEGDAYSIGLYYLKLREKFSIKPVRVHNHKTVMRAIVRVSVHGTIKHCLRKKQNEDCPGCAIDAPGQRHHDCVYWSLDDVNCKIKEISGSLCMESVLNIIITGYALQCLCLTQEHLALGAELVDKVTEAKDPNSFLDEIIKPTDKCLMQNVEHLLHLANY